MPMTETGEYITLTRFAYLDSGTYGEMEIRGHTIYTCERAWLNNAPGKSCIPEGSYEVVRHESPKFEECFALVGDGVVIPPTPDVRWGILFHPANWPDQLEGCIAPGLFFGPIPRAREWPQSLGVGQSRAAFNYLLTLMPDVWHLEITHREAIICPPAPA